jgi:hypothetical protein
MRDHVELILDAFNGLWNQGDEEEVPQDHFRDSENVVALAKSGFQSRPGVGLHQLAVAPLASVLRIYNYVTTTANTLLVLCQNTTGTTGLIYHVVNSTTVHGPILTITGMTDFAFVPYAGRAYISPFGTFGTAPNEQEKGLQNESLYVYKGDGSAARAAAGNAPTGSLTISNGAAGHTDAGQHFFGVVFESDTGWLSQPGAFTSFTTSSTLSVNFTTVPISAQTHITKRHIVATKFINPPSTDTTGFDYFFIPGATINDNVTTTLSNVSFFDADLVEDASHLLDNYSTIPAGASLSLYHNRLILTTTFTDIALALVSAPGEPEAISQIDGLLEPILDGNPWTNTHELRDLLYGFKKNRTVSWADNGDVPSSWPLVVVDYGLGCPVHGIATVVDSGAADVDFLIVGSYRGLVIFNGRYADPELSWKIRGLWLAFDQTQYREIQILNDTVKKRIYLTSPDDLLYWADYANGMDAKNVRWYKQRFDFRATTIALVNTSDLIIGSFRSLFP